MRPHEHPGGDAPRVESRGWGLTMSDGMGGAPSPRQLGWAVPSHGVGTTPPSCRGDGTARRDGIRPCPLRKAAGPGGSIARRQGTPPPCRGDGTARRDGIGSCPLRRAAGPGGSIARRRGTPPPCRGDGTARRDGIGAFPLRKAAGPGGSIERRRDDAATMPGGMGRCGGDGRAIKAPSPRQAGPGGPSSSIWAVGGRCGGSRADSSSGADGRPLE